MSANHIFLMEFYSKQLIFRESEAQKAVVLETEMAAKIAPTTTITNNG